MGKLYLIDDGATKIREYADRTGLPGFTANSLTTLQALEKELDRARRHGVAVDNEEAELGLRGVAAAVRDDAGELVAGISVSAPTDRYSADWAPLVQRTADEISRAIGYVVKGNDRAMT